MARPQILLVEDQPAVAEITADLLGEVYEVVVTARASEALKHLAAHGADLIVLDWRLPGGCAADVVAWADAAHVPVLVTSGDAGIADDMRADGRPCLMKPFSFNLLLQAVRSGLGQEASS